MSGSQNELIPISQKDDQLLVNARDLHRRLKIGKDFSTWIKDRIKEYGFHPDLDFSIVSPNLGSKFPKHGGQNKKEYFLTLDTAKELAMLERNEMGRLIRRYFIEAEKQLRSKRLYAQVANITDISKRVGHQRLNGRKMYVLRELRAYLGYSTKSSTSNVHRNYPGQIVTFNGLAYVSEEYVKVLMSSATTRALKVEAQAAPPLLPVGFGQPLSLFPEGGIS